MVQGEGGIGSIALDNTQPISGTALTTSLKVTVSKGPGKGVIVRGTGWVDVDKTNYKQYPF